MDDQVYFLRLIFSVENIVRKISPPIGCIGVAINLLVCFIFTKKPNMRTTLNVIWLNLAIADILRCMFSMIMHPLSPDLPPAFLGSETCTFIVYLSSLSGYFREIAIAAPLVVYSFYNEMNVRKCWLLMCSFWLFAMICAIIPGYNAIHISTYENVSFCMQSWTFTNNVDHEMLFEIFHIFIQLGLPVIITTSCIIAQKINRKSYSNNMIHRMCLRMVIIYIIMWTPEVVFFYRLRFYDTDPYNVLFYRLHLAGYLIAMLSMFYKPILYFIYDPQFAKKFESLMPFCKSSQAENYELHQHQNIME